MPLPRSAWWARPDSNLPESAATDLRRFRHAIERRITWYERLYPGEVDWEPVVWEAAYRAAFLCHDGRFWALFRVQLWKQARDYVQRHHRRKTKLRRHSLDDIEEPMW
jgi:hypothetical protein